MKVDIYEQMRTRFAATPMPAPSVEVTKDNEKLTQWYLENAFFRDFVYRNPQRRKGKEFSDALVVYDDTLVVVQNKTQNSPRLPEDWIESALNGALGQLEGSFRMITDRLVSEFANDVLHSKIHIDLARHTHIYGMVVVAQDSNPYDALPCIHKANVPSHPFIVVTLNDLLQIVDRMDTAADFITYLEMRHAATQAGIQCLMNDEINTMTKISNVLPTLLGDSLSSVSAEVAERTIRRKQLQLTTRARDRVDYKFSILVDDIVARAHDVDPDLVADLDSAKQLAHIVGQIYGYLDRERRIALGKKLLNAAAFSRTQGQRIVVHIQRPIGQVFLYLFTKADRKLRRDYLQVISSLAQEKYKSNRVVAVATEPAGMGGRSYDFVHLVERKLREGVDVPKAILQGLPDLVTMEQMIE